MLPDGDEAAALYEATAEAAAHFALAPYEVSNYAAPGAESRHNLAYWRYADYAGIGPGAHGRITLGGLRGGPGDGPGDGPVDGMGGGTLFATRRHRAPEIGPTASSGTPTERPRKRRSLPPIALAKCC